MTQVKTSVVLPNHIYDACKILSQLVLPGIAMLYFAGYVFWGIPMSILFFSGLFVVMAILGLVLGLSSRAYHHLPVHYDGYLDVSKKDTSKIHQLEITTDPDQLELKNTLLFKVRKVDGPS